MSTVRVPTRIELAPGADPASAPTEFFWESAGKRRVTSAIQITAGRDDEASTVEAGTMTATMDDRDGNLSPRNILGKWYGRLGKNTPARIVLDRGADTFNRAAVAAGGWGTSTGGLPWLAALTAADYSTDGIRGVVQHAQNFEGVMILQGAGALDGEIVWSTTLPVLPTGGAFVTSGVLRYSDNSNYVRAHVELLPAGAMQVKIQRKTGGSLFTILNNTALTLTYSAGQKVWGRARADGPYIMIKTWTGNLSDEPDTWDGSAIDETTEGSRIGLHQWRINSNAGTFTAYIDDVATAAVLWQGTIPEWPPRWPDKSGADSVTPIAGSGVLRRLQQGSSALESAMRHMLSALPYTIAYYPVEDGSDATSAASGLDRQPAAYANGITFAADDRYGGSLPIATFNTARTSYISARFKASPTPNGWAAMGFFSLPSLPATSQAWMVLTAAGTAAQYIVSHTATGLAFSVYDRNGSLLTSGSATYVVDPSKPCVAQIETETVSGTTTVTLLWNQIGSDDFWFASGSFSGTSTHPTSFVTYATVDGMSGGHFWFGDNDLPFVDYAFIRSATGFVGETAADRIARLCSENDVPITILSGNTEPMGRQSAGKLVDLLRECADADLGILYERGASLAYIPRRRRYNVPVTLALDWAAGHLAEPPEPQDDDQRYRNFWKVTRTGGSSAVAKDDAEIGRVGLYDDETEMNIQYDNRLIDFAGWLLNQGTADPLRWPRIVIDLVKNPSLIGSWLACRVGSRVTVANPPSQIAGERIDLIIEGYNETINNDTWLVEMACSPTQLWEVAIYDDATDRYDVDSTLVSDVTSTGQQAVVTAADRQGFWSSTSTPYNVVIAGQINTVIGCSLPDSVAPIDGTFEAGLLGGWKVSGGSIVDSTAQANRGSHSALLTTSGSPTQTIGRNSGTLSAAPGQTFTAVMYVRCSVARNVTATIDWYNGASFLSSSSNTVAVAANTWTRISVNGTAPASTTRIEYGPTMASSPANGTLLYFDDIDIARTDVTNSRQRLLLTRGVDGFTKSLPAGSSVRIANRDTRYAV